MPSRHGCVTNHIRVPDIRPDDARVTPRAQSIRADFGDNLIVDIARDEWSRVTKNAGTLWIEIPARALRRLN